jgi:chorismate-pyruvate lyase
MRVQLRFKRSASRKPGRPAIPTYEGESIIRLVPSEQARQLEELVQLFFPALSNLGSFTEVEAAALPATARLLLAHNRHMTATLEDFHGSSLRVEVLATGAEGDRYWRQIRLRRKTDGGVVQFAVVRVDFRQVDGVIRREIEEQGAPLGRILIEHNVSRSVVMLSLWQIAAAPALQRRLDMLAGGVVYGRTALIYCNGAPAIELLEILSPS